MSDFAVFGNPIKHSKSADIYALFAQEIGITEKYDLKLVSDKKNFDSVLFNFFKCGGLGANITLPFKEHAFLLCNQLTERAKMSRSVNVIKKKCNGDLLGDNTDGIGFINDLRRLRWINNNYMYKLNENLCCSRPSVLNILLIGAGGAAKGIVPELLTAIPNCVLHVVNRTYNKAQELTKLYCDMGYKNIVCMSFDELSHQYDLVINATVSSMCNEVPNISSCVISSCTKCYDLFYQKEYTEFLKWCQLYGSKNCVDGLGMLVEQAAYSFHLWHNYFPTNIMAVLSYLRSIL